MTTLEQSAGRRSDTVALLIEDNENRVLVLWHEKYCFWTVPLGKIEEGEAQVGAAQREAFEELGITSRDVQVLTTLHKPPNLDEYSDILITLCRVSSYTGEVSNREPHKHRELRFVHLSDMADLSPLSYPTRFIARSFEPREGVISLV